MRRRCRGLTRRGRRLSGRRGGSAVAVLLAMMLLTGFSSPAASDPLDPHLTSFEAFMDNPDLVPTVGYAFGLEAHYDDSMPGWVHGSMFEWKDGDWSLLTDSCFNISCVTGVEADPPEEISRPHDRQFQIVLYGESGPYDWMDLVVHEKRLHFTITMDFDGGYVTTYIPNAMGNTDLATVIHEDGAAINRCNVYWNYCSAEITAGHTYQATVEDEDGNVYGVGPSYTATSGSTALELVAGGVDVAKLAETYASTTEICDELLVYPYGTHVERSSVNDQWLACDTAVAARATKEEVLRAVSLAGAGVLSYLLYEKTAATLDPPFEAPHYYLPVTFPQPWPVGDISDSYMVQTRGKNSQDDTDVATGACLWYAARAGLNAREACTSMPIFFPGADTNSATTHDARQIFLHPEWVQLNYEVGESGGKRGSGWQNSQPGCRDVEHTRDEQCDEYPFFASEQGGPLARPTTPHVQYIDRIDNSRQGGFYSNFIRTCELRTGTPQTGLNSTGGTPFLVIPLMPALHIPTFYLCNRR